MPHYSRRDHFTAALLMLSAIEIIGLLSHRLLLNDAQLYGATVAGVAFVGFMFYNALYKYRITLIFGVIFSVVNLLLFFNLVLYISAWNGCKNWDGILLPNIVCGFKFMIKYYLPWLFVKVNYLIWFLSELLVVTLLISYCIAGRRLGLR